MAEYLEAQITAERLVLDRRNRHQKNVRHKGIGASLGKRLRYSEHLAAGYRTGNNPDCPNPRVATEWVASVPAVKDDLLHSVTRSFLGEEPLAAPRRVAALIQ